MDTGSWARPTRLEAVPDWPHRRPGTSSPTSRFAPPAVRDDMVFRDRVLAGLADSRTPVICLRAPAGYGKSTVISQWASRDGRPFAWIPLDPTHDDAVLLGSLLTAAIAAVEPSSTTFHPVVTGQEPSLSNVVLPALGQQLGAASTPFVMILDDLQVITEPGALRMLRLVLTSVPDGSQIVVISRTEPPIGLDRLRAAGRVTDIGADELAMDRGEARILLAGTGLSTELTEAVIAQSEGWPVGVYLAGMAARSRGMGGAVDRQPDRMVSGRERTVVDYLRAELWSGIDDETLRFLSRTSILTELTGPMCDAVLCSRGSGSMLRDLRASNMLVIPLDSQDHRFRYHHLLLDALRDELERRESDLIPELHDRAGRWFEVAGDIESAIRHAKLSGRPERISELIWSHISLSLGNGPLDLLFRWLDGIGPRAIAASPELVSASAWAALLDCDIAAMQYWIEVSDGHLGRLRETADAAADDGVLSEVIASMNLLRALRGDAGFGGIGELAGNALEHLTPLSAWRPLARFMMGIGQILTGDPGDAVQHFREGAALAAGIGGHLVRADCLVTLGFLAIETGQWEEGAALVGAGHEVIVANRMSELSTSAYSMSVVAMVQARSGNNAVARATLAHARRLTGEVSALAPWFQVLGRTLQATASTHLGDVPTARLLTREARQLLDAGAPSLFLSRMVERSEQSLLDLPADPLTGVSPLTTAELRVLQYLPTQLSFPEIAGSLFVSRHTIKTQALAIYHKLGVSSRTAAVDRARTLGLLPELPVVTR